MNFVIRVAARPLNDANGWWRGVAARCSIPKWKEDKGWQKHSSPTPPPHQPGLASHSPAAREPGPGQPGARLRVRKRPSALAHLQVRSRFRPAFPGRKLQGPRMRFPALLLGRERRSTASGDRSSYLYSHVYCFYLEFEEHTQSNSGQNIFSNVL